MEAFVKLEKVFENQRLLTKKGYCNESLECLKEEFENMTCSIEDVFMTNELMLEHHDEPNTALFSSILCFGTFVIAWKLKEFRNSHYLGRKVSEFFQKPTKNFDQN